MRKFTTLFLLALAMSIGASQAFAQNAAGAGNNGKTERSDPDEGREGDGGDRLSVLLPCSPTHGFGCFVPPRRPKPVKMETDDCSCVHKVMRVNGRFMPFIDCYNTVEINGREQLRYCTR